MTTTPAPSRSRGNLVADMIAGLTTGVANIPDAMASAILAGANPVQGLYALMIGTPLAALFGSSAFMNVVGHQRAGHHRGHGARRLHRRRACQRHLRPWPC